MIAAWLSKLFRYWIVLRKRAHQTEETRHAQDLVTRHRDMFATAAPGRGTSARNTYACEPPSSTIGSFGRMVSQSMNATSEPGQIDSVVRMSPWHPTSRSPAPAVGRTVAEPAVPPLGRRIGNAVPLGTLRVARTLTLRDRLAIKQLPRAIVLRHTLIVLGPESRPAGEAL